MSDKTRFCPYCLGPSLGTVSGGTVHCYECKKTFDADLVGEYPDNEADGYDESKLDQDSKDNPGGGVLYFKARFFGGPLDGTEREIGCNGGINDGFWWFEYASQNAIYVYERMESERYKDSDYRLYKTTENTRPH